MKRLLLAAVAALTMAAAPAAADTGTASCEMVDNSGNAVSWVWVRFGHLFSETFYSKNATVTMSPGYAQPTWTGSLVGGDLRISYDKDPRFAILVSETGFAMLFKNGRQRAVGQCNFKAIGG